jgi:hypothetical protein
MIKNRLVSATNRIKRLLILVSLKKSIDYNGSHAAKNMTLRMAFWFPALERAVCDIKYRLV